MTTADLAILIFTFSVLAFLFGLLSCFCYHKANRGQLSLALATAFLAVAIILVIMERLQQ
jgi:hypothetical protein